MGNSYDTALAKLETNNDGMINIFSTYFSSLHEEWIMMFNNGIIKIDNNKITVRGPTNNFDKNGFFKQPKIRFQKNLSIKDYELSLDKSISFFMKHVNASKKIPKIYFNKSIESNYLLFI